MANRGNDMLEKLPYNLTRLRLRLLQRSDLHAFHAYRSDPGVARYQGWSPMTMAEAAAFIDSETDKTSHAPGTWRQFALADLGTDMLLGDIGVWLSSDGVHAEFGLSLAPAAQGHGHGSECMRGLLELLFSSTTVTCVIARTDVRNLACVAALARAGMRPVATRQAEYKAESCVEQVFAARRSNR